MEWSELTATVAARAGMERSDAKRAVRATISSLVEALSTDEADALGRELPLELKPLVDGRAGGLPLARAALFERVAMRESVDVGFAVEHAECVCGALAEQMSPELRGRLQRHLPDLASLFDLRAAPADDAPPPVHGSTLASGRPGSRHPLSEAGPERARPLAPSRKTTGV
jgi:uncharacterized protein (DUF2267 family)